MRLRLLSLRSTNSTENWQVLPSAPSYFAVYSSLVWSRQEVFKAERVRWISAPSSTPLFPVCISIVARPFSDLCAAALVVAGETFLVFSGFGIFAWFVFAGISVGESGLGMLATWNPTW